MEMDMTVIMTDPKKSDYFYEEAIKTLRTNLQFSGAAVKNVVITSAFPNEGKSDIVIQLAREFGQIGKRVIVVDADIRRSCLVSRYDVHKRIHGLSHYLSGQQPYEAIVYQSSFPNVDIIFAGQSVPNPSELLAEYAFEDLLNYLREHYDYVLVDTPPIMSVIDASVVARACDGAVLVVESGRVSYKVAQKCQAQLAKARCRILGTVLNKVDVQKDRYYHRYGYYNKHYYKKVYDREN